LSAAGVVNGHDELTKRQSLFLLIGFHDTRLGRVTAQALWGVHPICVFVDLAPATSVRAGGVSTGCRTGD
jgi:hypothetical protein